MDGSKVKKNKHLAIHLAAIILAVMCLLVLAIYTNRESISTVLFAQTPIINYSETQKQTTFFEKVPTDTPRPTAVPIEYVSPVLTRAPSQGGGPTQAQPSQRPTIGPGTVRPTFPQNQPTIGQQPTSAPQPTQPSNGGNYCAPDTEIANGCQCKWSINQTGPVESFICTESGHRYLYFGRRNINNFLRFDNVGDVDFPKSLTEEEFNKAIQGSCVASCLEWDKPVVYLYPETPQYIDVAVEVPGEVIKSIPLYPEGGWQDVWAYPDGTLEYEGARYPYLFYETNAEDITPRSKTGIFVDRKTLKRDLDNLITQLGLIEQEKVDFLEYWVPRLSETNMPYIFVQTLPLDEKNKIDKLVINPAPDTFIHMLFMFYPVEKPFTYTKQIFPKPPVRTGFTAVEWGGTVVTR